MKNTLRPIKNFQKHFMAISICLKYFVIPAKTILPFLPSYIINACSLLMHRPFIANQAAD